MTDKNTNENVGLALRVLKDPIHLLAFGLGTGLSPVAPGTVGSLLGLAAAWATLPFDMPLRIAVGVAMVLGGIWLCGASARRIGVHDHPGIVWDEIAAHLPGRHLRCRLRFCCGPWRSGFSGCSTSVKPWPISDLDHRLKGGLGIMLDDLVAALYAAMYLALGGGL